MNQASAGPDVARRSSRPTRRDVRDDPVESDETLAQRAAEGDEAAFDTLVRRIHPKLARWALVKTGRDDDADEVVQRTLVRVHGALASFRGEGRLTTWVYRIAHNAWLDMERARESRSRHEEPLRERVGEPTPTQAIGPDERVERDEEAELVRGFFEKLAPRQREVLDLVDLQGYEPSEAAEVLQISASTARVHLHRARRSLRRVILDRHPGLAEEYGK